MNILKVFETKSLQYKFISIVVLMLIFYLSIFLMIGFYVLYEEGASAKKDLALNTNQKITNIKGKFWEIRFWERTLFEQSNSEADQRFGALIKEVGEELANLNNIITDNKIKSDTKLIANLFFEYENLFDDIIQIKTEQRLNQNYLESNYQALASGILQSDNISLMKLQYSLSRFHKDYLKYRRQSEHQAIEIVLASINELDSQETNSVNVNAYTTQYKKILNEDYNLEVHIRDINNNFNELSQELMSLFEEASSFSDQLALSEINSIKIIKNILFIIFALLTVVALLTFLLSINIIKKQIISPIKNLSSAVNEVERGNLNIEFSLKGDDEFTKLGVSFNRMVKSLNDSREKVKKQNDELLVSQEELKNRVEELERFNKAIVGRELKMVELKDKIKKLEKNC